ncbi:MAG: 4-hydroxy-3-methylbut-2-enyl diphosphate reductase [Bacteroidales bacterium]|nr:4-hydroxy-3-methylbut-2-enyl diphosphate reductase [Bacteroidales bacterium]
MTVTIDEKSGFCFGVREAIKKAEELVGYGDEVFCLGDIVHNDEEVHRLEHMGLKTIQKNEYFKLKDCKVLIRAHGEPPAVYEYAANNNIELINGTCPVVLKLQQKIKTAYENSNQVVVFGKPEHPEVIGLVGQTNYTATVVSTIEEAKKVNVEKDVSLFSQTTMDKKKYQQVSEIVEKKIEQGGCANISISQSICGQVANRGPWLEQFAVKFDAVVFVGGKKSSNSKVLFQHCLKVNPQTYFVTSVNELDELSLEEFNNVGVCGATSTPGWLMENIAKAIEEKYQ